MTLPPPDPAFHWTVEAWGPALRSRALAKVAQHAFTSRQLRLLPPTDEAWDAAVHSVGGEASRLMRVRQVHGPTVRLLARGLVPADAAAARPEADAVVSNEPGLVLAVVVADCVPILIADPVSGMAGAVHAGWRGTAAGIACEAVRAMGALGADSQNLVAAIGPSIGPGDYEVGENVATALVEAGHPRDEVARWIRRDDGRLWLDLWMANRDQLVAAGVPPAAITTAGLSTFAHPSVFESFRRDKDAAGRMAGLIVVPAPGGTTSPL